MSARRLILALGAAALALIAFSAALQPQPRLVWNVTPSVPTGLYGVQPGADFTRGDLVAVAPPDALRAFLVARGYLGETTPLLKHVAGLPGDRICRFGALVTLNGNPVAHAQTTDRLGRELPSWRGCRTLQQGEVFLLNAAPDSLDGRYFGALPATSVIGPGHPIWTRDG